MASAPVRPSKTGPLIRSPRRVADSPGALLAGTGEASGSELIEQALLAANDRIDGYPLAL